MAEQFSLCWDNFHSNMSTSFSELLKSEDLVDVTLAAEGRYLKAHKIVLSVCSPYFQELFHVNPCQHPIVFLKDVSYSALSNLLQFMYQGEVKVSQDELTNFIKVAEALKIKGLTGDGVKDNDEKEAPTPPNDLSDINVPKETTLSRKSSYGRTSPTRKKMLGPASKRPRQELPEIPPHMIEDVRSIPPETEQFMNFKMEPEDIASTYDENNEDFNYDDTNADVSNMSDSADYLLEAKMDNSMKDVKPGTSTTNADPTADNQGNKGLAFAMSQRGKVSLLLDGYLFIVNRRENGSIFWQCSEYRQYKCRCRVVTKHKEVKRNRFEHNHVPNVEKVEQKFKNDTLYTSLPISF